MPHGSGDPYVLKFRGVYYLYCSNDREQALRCLTSKDLVHWSDAIICSTDPTIVIAYAPEVIYWNGMFYMYTSPNGGGHYVLSSDSPTGPFTRVTDNYFKEIDGSVFIDDDGRMYFYHAHNDGIHGSAMSSPTTFGSSVNLGARMSNQWTEGPCVFKRNGVYYLLYTGNHVLSEGYRVDYAKSSTPIGTYTPQAAQNPILVRSEGTHVGLGHGSAFVGPDLDTYYFTYHNLVTIGGGQPYRKYNFDRIAWNGEKLALLGPTNYAQQAPQLATADYFGRAETGTDWTFPNGGNWGISGQDYLFQGVMENTPETGYKAIFTAATATGDFTAEFTVREVARQNNSAQLGAIFSYSDEQNYGIALLDSYANKLVINFLTNNVWGTAESFTLPTGFNYAVWHSLRIEKNKTAYAFFVDGMRKATITSTLGGGRVGYVTRSCTGNFGYIALSNQVNGSGIYDVYKPLPGTISAVHYNTGGEGVGYHDLTPGNTNRLSGIRNDSVETNRTSSDGSYYINGNQTGEWYKYNVNIASTGVYNVGIRYSAAANSSGQLRIRQGADDVSGVIDLPPTGSLSTWRTLTVRGLHLTAGYQTLKVETVTGGDFNFYEMQFKPAANEAVAKTDDFEAGFSADWNYSDGDWKIESGQATINGFGKRTFGDTGWTDYTLEADVTYLNGMNGGLLVRVNNPAIGGAHDSPDLGTDYLQGYFVGLGSNNVALGKHNYGWTALTTAPGSYSQNTTYHLKVVTTGANIKVYVDDMDTPKIDYTDANPFIDGKVGLRACGVHVRFDNFSVTAAAGDPLPTGDPEPEPPTGTKEISKHRIEMFPNPVHDILTVQAAQKSLAAIYNETGKLMISQALEGSHNNINVAHLTRGIYIIKLSGDGRETTGKFIKD